MKALPEIMITTTNRKRLALIATTELVSEHHGLAASMLLSEIARATVVPEDSLPPNVIDMDCDVEIRDNIAGVTKHLRIVYPGEEDSGGHSLSVLTPLGAALLGLSEGASIDWCTATADRRSITVLQVHRRAVKKNSDGSVTPPCVFSYAAG